MLLWGLCAFVNQTTINEPEAAALLQKVSDKYKSYKNISASFRLLISRPKVKPDDDERKLTDTIDGTVLLEGAKFHIQMDGQQIYCDGKNVWTYIASDKEVQVNYFEENEESFSPSKIFSMYAEGYSYRIKEKKTVGNKPCTVVEMSPVNKKVSYFKIDVTIDDNTQQITESKIYERNGVRYIYKITKQSYNISTSDASFTFDVKRFPGVKVVDLR
ncbi:MAG: outer membrane lipoprotein carrier protein LolA [Chitinophagales bacterium]|nr:outer membrane lipoprotein carrier protein LolA [Chitinophagales bacterium]MDW8418989.1 outer membrane lipoprotein carrier protein LolA [Chitinophagales bacterium]